MWCKRMIVNRGRMSTIIGARLVSARFGKWRYFASNSESR